MSHPGHSQKVESPVRIRRDEIHTHSATMRHLLKVFPGIRTIEDCLQRGGIGIPVYPQDIQDAEPGNPARCAVALGACRHYPGVTGALIGRAIAVVVFDHTRAIRFSVPKSTYANLFAFDRGGKVEPGVYALGSVCPSSRLIPLQGRIMQSKAMRGRRAVGKGAKRPSPKGKRHLSSNPRSLLLRTWGDASIGSTFVKETDVQSSVN